MRSSLITFTGTRQREAIEPWCGNWIMYKPWGSIWTAKTDQQVQLARHPWVRNAANTVQC